jgi:deoxyribonuclease V
LRTEIAEWPIAADELERVQVWIASTTPESWVPQRFPKPVGACFVCFAPWHRYEKAFAAAVLVPGGGRTTAVVEAKITVPYQPGLLALREGPVLEAAARALPELPELMVVNATGLDHPRRAGLAIHLGAVLEIPTIGITERPLVAEGALPGPKVGDTSPLYLEGEVVANWIRTREGTRPVIAHAGWRTSADTAAWVTAHLCRRFRTPEPMRRARRAARLARSASSGDPETRSRLHRVSSTGSREPYSGQDQ